jgi:hypothetical protein
MMNWEECGRKLSQHILSNKQLREDATEIIATY